MLTRHPVGAARPAALARIASSSRLHIALLPPLIALGVQLAIWSLISPYVWFLFFPAVFISSWLGSRRDGFLATALSALMVWWFFVEPVHTLVKPAPKTYFPLVTFLICGSAFTMFHERLRAAHRRVEELLESSRELDALKTQFFANVSHELRTPLTLILGPVQSLLSSEDTTDAQRTKLEIVNRQGHQLLRQVNELLEASRLEAGGVQIDRRACDLAGLVRLIGDQFESAAATRDVALTVEAPASVVATVDPERVERAITNLVANAVKFTPSGGRIRLAVSADSEHIWIDVCDSGPGIAEVDREAVFEPFRQVEGTVTRSHGGAGLGLAIAREIAELHDGSLTVATAAEGGAAFTLMLPVIDVDAAPAQLRLSADTEVAAYELRTTTAMRPPARQGHDRPMILVIEDHPDLGAFLLDTLTESYHVELATDGRSGLDAARRLRPTLILCDVMMPVMGGEEFVRAARADAVLADTPIVMLTARTDDQTRVDLLRAGANDYLTKPIVLEEMLVRIENLARLRVAERARIDALNRAEAFLQAGPDATIVVNEAGRIVRANRKAEDTFGYSIDELLDQPVELLLPEHIRTRHPALRSTFTRNPHARAMGSGLELSARRADGSMLPVDVSLSPVQTEEGLLVIAAVRDTTAQRKIQRQLQHMAMHDALTGLPNRSLLIDRISQASAAAERTHDPITVLYIDIDRFKQINDERGHAAGDAVLVEVARRLRTTVRPHDTVARLGGDEFAVVCENLPGSNAAMVLGERIRQAMAEPISFAGDLIDATVSVGIASSDRAPVSPDSLLTAADTAMYRAKKLGRSRVEFFDNATIERIVPVAGE